MAAFASFILTTNVVGDICVHQVSKCSLLELCKCLLLLYLAWQSVPVESLRLAAENLNEICLHLVLTSGRSNEVESERSTMSL